MKTVSQPSWPAMRQHLAESALIYIFVIICLCAGQSVLSKLRPAAGFCTCHIPGLWWALECPCVVTAQRNGGVSHLVPSMKAARTPVECSTSSQLQVVALSPLIFADL